MIGSYLLPPPMMFFCPSPTPAVADHNDKALTQRYVHWIAGARNWNRMWDKTNKKKNGESTFTKPRTRLCTPFASQKPPGGRRSPVSLCRVCVCVNTWYTWAAAPPLTETAPGLAAQWTTPKLCVYACLRYDCLVFKLFLFCLFFLYIPSKHVTYCIVYIWNCF